MPSARFALASPGRFLATATTPARVAAELHHLLDNPMYMRRPSDVRNQVLQEDGVQVACDALSELLQRASSNRAK
jgi:UDP:flavonoid glycosyltransferase YjiC (YdhE family)